MALKTDSPWQLFVFSGIASCCGTCARQIGPINALGQTRRSQYTFVRAATTEAAIFVSARLACCHLQEN